MQLQDTCMTGSQAEKHIRLCVWLERQADAGRIAGGTQKVRWMEGRQMDKQTDR